MIVVRDLTVRAGAFLLEEICFQAKQGEYVCLMGKTGCGKTTLLESICGLRMVESGRIELVGRDVTRLRPAERGVGYVPQDGALFSTMTVRDHLAFAMTIRHYSVMWIDQRVTELARMLNLEHLLYRKPQGLSGGESQRVALGRALAVPPGVLCLDEPLNALDHETHAEMCNLLKGINRKLGITTLHVTHSMEEARRLADRILVIQAGAIAEMADLVSAGAARGMESAT